MKGFIAFLTGLLFALGLGVSGMTQPHIVRGFLDVFGHWDWRLLGVMAGAVGVHAVAYRLIIKRTSPLLDTKFQIPSRKDLDGKLIAGAVIFGLGWGWAGVCPGPGIVALASGERSFIYFVISMFLGMKIFQWLDARLLSKQQ